MECVPRGMQLVMWQSAIHRDSVSGIRAWSIGHKGNPPKVSIQESPGLTGELFLVGSTFGEPVTG